MFATNLSLQNILNNLKYSIKLFQYNKRIFQPCLITPELKWNFATT